MTNTTGGSSGGSTSAIPGSAKPIGILLGISILLLVISYFGIANSLLSLVAVLACVGALVLARNHKESVSNAAQSSTNGKTILPLLGIAIKLGAIWYCLTIDFVYGAIFVALAFGVTLYSLIMKKEEAANGPFALAFGLHILDSASYLSNMGDVFAFSAITSITKLIAYIILGYYTANCLHGEQATWNQRWGWIGLGILTYALPIVTNALIGKFGVVFVQLHVFLPIFVILIFIKGWDHLNGMFRLIAILYFGLLFLSFFASLTNESMKNVASENLGQMLGVIAGRDANLAAAAKNSGGTSPMAGLLSPALLNGNLNEQIRIALGQAKNTASAQLNKTRDMRAALMNDSQYTGSIDRNAKEKLGVSFEKFKLDSDSNYWDYDTIGLYGILVAKTLDRPINITLGCAGKNVARETEIPAQQIHPNTQARPLNVAREEAVDVDCIFNASSLGIGSSEITLRADFTFKTLAYLKRYYMAQDALRALRTRSIDPFQQYAIVDRNPNTIYTAGPVMLGMDAGQPLTPIDSTRVDWQPSIGITLSNKWDGMITKVNRFVLFLPKGLRIRQVIGAVGAEPQEITCNDLASTDAIEAATCSDDLNNIYDVKITGDQDPIKLYRTYRFLLDSDQPGALLGPGPLATRFYRASVDYEYRLEKKTRVTVQNSTSKSKAVRGSDIPPVIVLQEESSIGTRSANISIMTDQETNARVSIYSLGSSKRTFGASAFSTNKTITLTNLNPATLYYYELEVSNGKTATQAQRRSFTTLDKEPEPLPASPPATASPATTTPTTPSTPPTTP